MSHLSEYRRLRSVLLLDAASCFGMAVMLLAGSGLISRLTSIPAALLFWAGLLLVPVAGFIAISAKAQPVPAPALNVVIAANVVWVLASLALPLTGRIAPNAPGWVFILVQAAVVALFAWLEWTWRRPARRSADLSAAR